MRLVALVEGLEAKLLGGEASSLHVHKQYSTIYYNV